ncbi:MFS transporter, partial [Bacteroides sp.]
MNNTEKGSKAYLFSIVLVAVLGGLLFGYDTAVISGAEKGLQAFFMGASDFTYTDAWHGITSSSALIGCIIGSAISGFFASRFGRKNSLFMAGIMFFLSALGSYWPEFLFFDYGKPTYSLLIAFNFYRVLGGVGVGLASAICPMYIAEIAPSNIRGTLVSWNQFAIIFGQLVVYFVNFLILGDNINPVIKAVEGVNQIINPGEAAWTIETGWRLMFVSEAVPAGLFTLLVLLVPETPRYLAMVGKDEKALFVLSRINGLTQAKAILQDIKATAEEKTEKLFTYGWTVIFVGIMLSVFQQAVGINAVLYFAPRIF